MPNQTGTDIHNQLHSQDAGYVQALENAAYLIVARIDEMFDAMIGGDEERFVNYIQDVSTAKDDKSFEAVAVNPDIQVLDAIAGEIVPTISETYEVDIPNVTSDLNLMVEHYALKGIIEPHPSDC